VTLIIHASVETALAGNREDNRMLGHDRVDETNPVLGGRGPHGLIDVADDLRIGADLLDAAMIVANEAGPSVREPLAAVLHAATVNLAAAMEKLAAVRAN
jgi:hypothetical protein